MILIGSFMTATVMILIGSVMTAMVMNLIGSGYDFNWLVNSGLRSQIPPLMNNSTNRYNE